MLFMRDRRKCLHRGDILFKALGFFKLWLPGLAPLRSAISAGLHLPPTALF